MMGGYGYGNNNYNMMGYNGVFNFYDVILITLILIIGLLVFFLIKDNLKTKRNTSINKINIKLAKGELTLAEYHELKKVIVEE